MAARLRDLIAAGPNATGPPVVGRTARRGQPGSGLRDGELPGIALQNLRPDGLYARLGLREGDVVASINGVPLDASGALLQRVLGSPQIELTSSAATARSISVPRERMLEGLRELESSSTTH